jgi:hypothetical protein
MLVSNAGPDRASRAALRLLMRRLPGMSAVEGAPSIEPIASSDPPILRAATIVEGSTLRAVRIPNLSDQTISGFGAFLDGTQKVQNVGHHNGMPIVLGVVSAAVRVRVNRRLITWGHQPPRVERRFYLPLRYLPPLAEIREVSPKGSAEQGEWEIVDTSTADANGDYPSQHPSVLLERAVRAVDRERDLLEDRLAVAWCMRAEAPIFIDGGISRSPTVAASSCAVGVIKSHRTLYAEGDALRMVLGLQKGERSSVFRVAPRSRSSVLSWYLRLRSAGGHAPLWGLVRVEVAECDRPAERADEISRWVLAETSPLALPDGRWDKMAYGVRDCEEFLRAIS